MVKLQKSLKVSLSGSIDEGRCFHRIEHPWLHPEDRMGVL
jgi:hypothetical protein